MSVVTDYTLDYQGLKKSWHNSLLFLKEEPSCVPILNFSQNPSICVFVYQQPAKSLVLKQV